MIFNQSNEYAVVLDACVLGILCQTPDEFLVHQFHLNPQLVVEKLDIQAAAINQPRSDTIKKLEKATPVFCSLLDKHFLL